MGSGSRRPGCFRVVLHGPCHSGRCSELCGLGGVHGAQQREFWFCGVRSAGHSCGAGVHLTHPFSWGLDCALCFSSVVLGCNSFSSFFFFVVLLHLNKYCHRHGRITLSTSSALLRCFCKRKKTLALNLTLSKLNEHLVPSSDILGQFGNPAVDSVVCAVKTACA